METVKRSRIPYGTMAGASSELRSAYYLNGWFHDADIPELPQPKWNPDTPVTPDEVLTEQQTVVEIGTLLDELTPRQAKILRLRFGFNCPEFTLEEVGNIFELTRERIRQIEHNALRKLRTPERRKRIESLLGRI